MCVIIVCTDKGVSEKTLFEAEKSNKDGGGVAWRENGKVRYVKGIPAAKIVNIVKHIKLPYVIHFRLGTVGGNGIELCHPFPISSTVELSLEGESDSVIFHNGHWTSWNKYLLDIVIAKGIKLPLGHWSDSRALALMCHYYGYNILTLVDEKACILTPKNIYLYGTWVNEKGISFSNKYFENERMFGWIGKNGKYTNDWYDADKEC